MDNHSIGSVNTTYRIGKCSGVTKSTLKNDPALHEGKKDDMSCQPGPSTPDNLMPVRLETVIGFSPGIASCIQEVMFLDIVEDYLLDLFY